MKKRTSKSVNYFDIHSHLHSDFFNRKENGQIVAKEMKERGFFSTIIGVSFDDSQKAVDMAGKNKNLFCSIGIHPTEKEEFSESDFKQLLQAGGDKVVCIGECGLDYY